MVGPHTLRIVVTLSLILSAASGQSLAGQGSTAHWTRPPEMSELRYAVTRNGRLVGHHTIRFFPRGLRYEVITRTRVKIKAAFFTVYRFKYDSREIWHNGELLSFSAKMDRDGERSDVDLDLARDIERIKQKLDGPEGVAPGDITPGQFWAEWQISRPFYVDPQNGQLNPLQVEPLGMQDMALGKRKIEASRYLVSGEKRQTLWFGPDRLLVKMQLVTEDRSNVELTLLKRTPSRPDSHPTAQLAR